MNKGKVNLRSISRRDTLKASCLVPAGAIATRLLVGCNTTSHSPSKGASVTAPDGSAASAAGGTGPTNTSTGGRGAPSGASANGSSGVGGNASSSVAGAGGNASPMLANAGAPASGGVGGASMTAGAGGQISGSAGNTGVAAPGTPWASGGTKSMTGGYPDPFSSSPGTTCVLYPSQTIGPCYAQMPMLREDISDGLGGLPLRLSLLVVRANGCTPVANASVDIWHSGSAGIYSAYASGTICNPSQQNVQSMTFCRGVQLTDASGKVEFSSVFPGWYTGRSIHIHFTIRLSNQEYVTSQLYFEDALDNEILAQGDYKTRGMRDTTNATDMTFLSGGAKADQVLLSTAKRPDGVLHAWKVLSIG